MKILVLNLLRLGDTIMSVPVINGLKTARSDAQVDLLTFRGSLGLKPMLKGVRKWWTIDRDELQAGLGQAEIPLLTSFAVLQEQLDAINAEEYDLIVNLSQTKFSAYIAGYLRANDRLGLAFDVKGIPHFYSTWFRYLNDQPEKSESIFHYTDIFMNACGLGGARPDWSLKTSAADAAEVDGLSLRPGAVATFQILTSSEDKNWGLNNWLELAVKMKVQRPDLQIVALGAPSEAGAIAQFREEASKRGVTVVQAILSLGAALELLNRSEILITGDTSIKHLANASKTKIVEICLGWSDWRRTGIYKNDSLIVRNDAGADNVAQASLALMAEDWDSIVRIARELQGASFLRSHRLQSEFWFANDLSADHTSVEILVERSAWKMSLNRGRKLDLLEFGSVGMNLRTDLKKLFDASAIPAHLNFLEEKETRASREFTSMLMELKRERPSATLDLVHIGQHRKKQMGLETAFEHTEFKTKILRALKSNWTENL